MSTNVELQRQRDRIFVFNNNQIIEEFSSIQDALDHVNNGFVFIDRFLEYHKEIYSWRLSIFLFYDENKNTIKLSNN